MPTYDYKCKKCGYTFEEFQSMKSELLVICPSCGKPGLVRLMASGVGMIFKGSGFYQTDYKNTKSSHSTSSSKSNSTQSDKKPGPASKPDSAKTDDKTTPPPKSDSSKPDKPDKSDK
jgi:putative FmdB family regulatory protein